MKKNDEFLDVDHKTMDTFYALMEKNISHAKMKRTLEEIIVIDPDFYDPYVQLANLLQEDEEYDKANKILNIAYHNAIAKITDKNGNFPKSLPWVHLENRHIIRAIDAWATELWEQGKIEEALAIFRKLLKSN